MCTGTVCIPYKVTGYNNILMCTGTVCIPYKVTGYNNILMYTGTVCVPYKVTGYNNILHILSDTQTFKSKACLIQLMLLLYRVHCQL